MKLSGILCHLWNNVTNIVQQHRPQKIRNAVQRKCDLVVGCLRHEWRHKLRVFNTLIYMQQDATLHSLFYLETALHVSGGTTAHHQNTDVCVLDHGW
jgi:hypothetical protein